MHMTEWVKAEPRADLQSQCFISRLVWNLEDNQMIFFICPDKILEEKKWLEQSPLCLTVPPIPSAYLVVV